MVGIEEVSATRPPRRVTGHGGNPPGSGPFMTVTVSVSEGVVRDFAYQTYSCPGAHACGKALGELTKDQPLETSRGITRATLVEWVGPLPRQRETCYSLTLLALDDALNKLDKPGSC